MTDRFAPSARLATLLAATSLVTLPAPLLAQPQSLQTPPVPITVKEGIEVPATDARTDAVVAAAQAFPATLDEAQRAAAVFPFEDNTQRANWSNFPDGAVQRAGVMRGDMTGDQLAALDALLLEVLGEDGLSNVHHQLAADDVLGAAEEDDGPGGANFGSEFYYVSFLGEPAADAPFAVQFGGHHLAVNALFLGGEASFSPMLTGGEPLRIDYEGTPVTIAEAEYAAAMAFMASLDETQRAAAIRGDEPINLVLGPGEFGTAVAPEGVKGADLSEEQKALLVDVVAARLGLFNADDAGAALEEVRAGLDDTFFAWWGPAELLGAAYWRVTAPTAVIEYAPQDQDGDATDHAHNMYRNPANDYGAAWIAE